MRRTIFIVSDHTGVTAQTVARSLLSQFDEASFSSVFVPFTDSVAKVRALCDRLITAGAQDGARPIVLSTLTDRIARDLLRGSGALVLDLFEAFIGVLEGELACAATPVVGKAHGLSDHDLARRRILAVKYALATDDGARETLWPEADVIVLGPSRVGKTPVCLYLALQRGIRAANVPLTEELLARGALTEDLLACRDRLVGLTMSPEALHRLREERWPNSAYSSLVRCREEISRAGALLRAAGATIVDATQCSVEEVAGRIVQSRQALT